MNYKGLLFTLLALPIASFAAENQSQTPKNTVRFSVEAEKEVAFDILQVKLFVQEENTNLKVLHQTISTKLNQALAKIKAQPAVEIKSNDHQTYARYNNAGKKNGWGERADFVLESRDFYALSQLVDELSEQLSIEYINPILSAEAIAKEEEALSKMVISKFQQKADLIATSLKSKGYKLLSLDFPSVHGNYHYHQDRAMYVSAKMAEAEPVQLEGGKTKVKTLLEASIELIED